MLLLQKTTSEYNYAIENYVFSQGDVGKLCIEIQNSNTLVRDLLLQKDHDSIKDSEKKLTACLNNINN